jgi:NAD(P)-dependent dehydrogenase (short-subunit alcohol dehydrogenase family)
MLKGRIAVVTGSTSGIGLGMARALAAEGCNIMMNGFGDPAEIEQQRGGLEKDFGVKALFNGADLSKGEQCADLIQDAGKRFGKLDILVNNAGIQHVCPIESFPVDTLYALGRGSWRSGDDDCLLTLLASAECPIWPWQLRGSGLVAEAFPAAQLKEWRLPHHSYGRDDAASAGNGRTIVTGLNARVHIGDFESLLVSCPDALDS